jgi:hypothetical protein
MSVSGTHASGVLLIGFVTQTLVCDEWLALTDAN